MRVYLLSLIVATGFVVLLITLVLACVGKATHDKSLLSPAEWILPYGVSEFHLEDGTRCVIADHYQAVSVDCDWDYQKMREGGGETY